MLDKDVTAMQLDSLENIKKGFRSLRTFGFCLCLTILTVPLKANAQGFGKESDMVKGAKNNSVGVMERGFIEGHSPNSRSREGDPVLVIVAENGYELGVRYLISRGARVNDRGLNNRTPLGVAAAAGHSGILEHLLKGGADPDKTGLRREVPLIRAARNGHLEAVKVLIENGAYPDDTDLTGRTALDWAREQRHRKIVSYLEAPE
jgi:ankyrin repeat protein